MDVGVHEAGQRRRAGHVAAIGAVGAAGRLAHRHDAATGHRHAVRFGIAIRHAIPDAHVAISDPFHAPDCTPSNGCDRLSQRRGAIGWRVRSAPTAQQR